MVKKKSRAKKFRLCVYLFNDDCLQWDEALKDSTSLTPYPIRGIGSETMLLFVKSPVSFLPKWARFFEDSLEKELEGLFNSSTSAALLVKQEHRIFAFTFGYGRSLLDLTRTEEAFGLKIALNSIDEDKIRSIDIKNLDTVVRHSKVQTSQVGSVENFGMNIDRDILNAVTGLSNDPALGQQMSGACSLHINLAVTTEGLGDLCSVLLNKFREKTYQKSFPWVDHITDVKNDALIKELNGLLLEAINKKEFGSLFLAVPGLIDWERVQGFKYNHSEEEIREDIHIADVLSPRDGDEKKVDLAWLKKKTVYCVGAEADEIVDDWPLYSCINHEVKKDGSTFLLTAGKWFKINDQYVNAVVKEIEEIPEYKGFAFPESQGEKEGDYNERVAKANKKRCVLMDRKNIPYGGGQSKIEFCDLFIDKKCFVHVKRFRGSSSLSHLFFQGHNAAFLFLSELNFLKRVNKELPVGWEFNESQRPQAADYEIVFAIISKTKKGIKGTLPFFSKVSLMQIYKQLRVYGYNVSVAKIKVTK